MNEKEVSKFTVESWKKYGDEIVAYIERLELALSEQVGVIQEIEPFPPMPEFFEGGLCLKRQYNSNKVTSDEAKERIKKWYDECVAIRERNAPKLEANRLIVKRLRTILKSSGMPESVASVDRGKSGRANPKNVWKRAGWVVSLESVPTHDCFDAHIHGKDKMIQRVEAIVAKLEAEAEKKEREVAAQEEARRKQVEYISALLSLDLPATTEPGDAMDAVLGKNQYLRLAHYMKMNRLDWSEGCYYAEIGLRGFVAESEEDHLIRGCIQSLCNDWDRDGRVFRDCEYNYNILFQKVQDADPKLKDAYDKILEVQPSW